MNHLWFLHIPLELQRPKVEHCSGYGLTHVKSRGIITYFNLSAVLLMQLSACFASFALLPHIGVHIQHNHFTVLFSKAATQAVSAGCVLMCGVIPAHAKKFLLLVHLHKAIFWPNTRVSQHPSGPKLCCLVGPPSTPSAYYDLQICG